MEQNFPPDMYTLQLIKLKLFYYFKKMHILSYYRLC
jgi:hypothetical protein